MLKERPIIFSGPMVRAILEGRKTQTRRVLAKQPTSPATIFTGIPEIGSLHQFWAIWPSPTPDENGHHPDDACKFPYGFVGDRLWVRETWQYADHAVTNGDPCFVYRATDPDWETMEGWSWRSPIHMPRRASRITLEIIGVRVERLQDISEDDAIAELGGKAHPNGVVNTVGHFQEKWDEINGKSHPWESNPWVWAIEFKKVNPGE
jgi:hypothetical protein